MNNPAPKNVLAIIVGFFILGFVASKLRENLGANAELGSIIFLVGLPVTCLGIILWCMWAQIDEDIDLGKPTRSASSTQQTQLVRENGFLPVRRPIYKPVSRCPR